MGERTTIDTSRKTLPSRGDLGEKRREEGGRGRGSLKGERREDGRLVALMGEVRQGGKEDVEAGGGGREGKMGQRR